MHVEVNLGSAFVHGTSTRKRSGHKISGEFEDETNSSFPRLRSFSTLRVWFSIVFHSVGKFVSFFLFGKFNEFFQLI